MFGFGENKSRTFLQNGDPVGSINSASLHLRGKSMGYSEKVRDKKKNLPVFLLVFFVASGLLFVFAGVHTAQGVILEGMVELGMWGGEKIAEGAVESLAWVFKWLLYGIFSLIGWLVSVAITLFGWAIDPKYISGDLGLLSRGSIYEMWKFIRDFFNLFFILVLLYIAFTVVFQIQKDFKKALLSLVLAALFINFSFPVTRFLIDATNVPMYFFVNQMLIDKDNPGKSLGTVLKAAHLQKILLPKEEESDISQLLAAIVFMFIFAITLLVLAIMFVIRLVALLILLIFSPVGFAASIIPGMEKYSKMWWESFWQYALFGPAAMLMLLIAMRFFSEISDEKNALFAGMKIAAAGVTVPTELDFIASMAMFSIPIIMLWMAMGLAQKMSIAGASSVVGAGQKFAKWAGKKTMDGGKWLTYKNPVARGVGGGVKDRFDNNRLVKFFKSPSKTEAVIKGAIGTGTAQGELAKIHDKKVAEEEKKMDEQHLDKSALVSIQNNGRKSAAEREAAVRSLSKKDHIQNAGEMAAAIAAMNQANAGNGVAQAEKRNELIRKAGGEIYQNGADLAGVIGHLGTDIKAINQLIDKASGDALDLSGPQYQAIVAAGPAVRDKLTSKLKKEGRTAALIEARPAGQSQRDAIDALFDSMPAEDVGKQRIFSDPRYQADAIAHMVDLQGGTYEDVQRAQEIRRKMIRSVSSLIP